MIRQRHNGVCHIQLSGKVLIDQLGASIEYEHQGVPLEMSTDEMIDPTCLVFLLGQFGIGFLPYSVGMCVCMCWRF